MASLLLVLLCHLTLVLVQSDSFTSAKSSARIATFQPRSYVTDHARIDLDVQALAHALSQLRFDSAKAVYELGGHSAPMAFLTVEPLRTMVLDNTMVRGQGPTGARVSGLVSVDAARGDTELKVAYVFNEPTPGATTLLDPSTSSTPSASSGSDRGALPCVVGGLEVVHLAGCFAPGESIEVSGLGALALINVTNGNDRTLSGFSENAREEMFVRGEPTCSSCYWQYIRCRGCPYKDYLMYYEYYQDVSYADRWVRAALDGAPTGFNSSEGDADFTNADDAVRVESAKTGIVAMSVWMYITRKFEEGLDDCDSRCVSCNFNGVHAWDEAVAFYAGSLVGKDGLGIDGDGDWDDGEMLFSMANQQCKAFATCVEGTDGNSRVNELLFSLFVAGQKQIHDGSCKAARRTVERIVDLMAVPLIQGTLRSAYHLSTLSRGPAARGLGATYAAAVLPRLAHCSSAAASDVYVHMRIGATLTDFETVRAAFEGQYACLNITCADVGGLWDEDTDAYHERFAPCLTASPSPPPSLPPPFTPLHPLSPSVPTPSPSEPSRTWSDLEYIGASAVLLGLAGLILFCGSRTRRWVRRRQQARAFARIEAMRKLSDEHAKVVESAVSSLPTRCWGPVGAGGSAAGHAGTETAHSATTAIELQTLPRVHISLPAEQASATCSDRSREEECSICLVAYTLGDELKDLPCGHCFHNACIDEWLLRKSRPLATESQFVHSMPMCPLCKAAPFHIPTPLVGAMEPGRRAGGRSSMTSSFVLPA